MKKATVIAFCVMLLGMMLMGCSSNTQEAKYSKEYDKINITMSSIIMPVNLEDKSLGYLGAYDSYDKKDSYDFYNCVFKVENNSRYDVYDIKLSESSGSNFIADNWCNDYYCPYLVGSKETGYISTVISVKKNVSEKEKQEIIEQIKKEATVFIGKEQDGKRNNVDYAKVQFKTSSEDYFPCQVQYPDGISGSVIISRQSLEGTVTE